MPYDITWYDYLIGEPAGIAGRRTFDHSIPFHSAVSEVLNQAGPVGLDNLATEMRVASSAGAHVDPLALIEVISAYMGVFGGTGEACRDTGPTIPLRHQILPSTN